MLSVMLVHILVYKSSIKKRYTETVCRSSIQKQQIEKAYRISTQECHPDVIFELIRLVKQMKVGNWIWFGMKLIRRIASRI